MLESSIISCPLPDEGPSQWRIEDMDMEQINAIPGKIEILPMAQRSEVQDWDEDWTGKTSTALRRKLQNRLNQRASRKRRKQATTTQKPQVFVQDNPSSSSSSPPSEKHHDLVHPLNPNAYIFEVATRPKPGSGAPSICIYSATRRVVTGAPSFAAFLSTPLPVDQKLMTLLHFNLVRALVQNVHILGLDPDLMEDDIPSPFQASAHDVRSLIAKLPPTLKPTQLQLTVPHHPEVDGLPFPQLRDNFIRAGETFNTDEFCMDMLYGLDAEAGMCTNLSEGKGGEVCSGGRTGLIVWSDPWLSGSWEVEEGFARKYGWLLRGCGDIMESTNFWRRSRGEKPLRFEEVD
ncbi:hypothetical protein BKA65DRAFT_516958, partial [Rhexocercosporidium sp. MPI-PUGE-AT-0058]